MDIFKLQKELEETYITIDVDKLSKTNIKKIVILNSQLFNLKFLDENSQHLSNTSIFDCLQYKDKKSAKNLNKIYTDIIKSLAD